jgi:hypothetical protein
VHVALERPLHGHGQVFGDHADLHRRIDDESLPIDENSVLVLKQVGPRGAPGMPEWGAAPIPTRLLRRGIKDMVRISDARMSGTPYGTVVLHVAPESAVGGPLALVRDGDEIELDVPGRRLTLKVGGEELARRQAAWTPRPAHFSRGYGKLFLDHVLQANAGCDFDYLRGRTPVRHEDTAGPSHSQRMCALRAVAGLGPRRPRRAYESPPSGSFWRVFQYAAHGSALRPSSRVRRFASVKWPEVIRGESSSQASGTETVASGFARVE